MVINKSKVTIRPEKPSEYEEVNKLIFEAFAEQHNIEIGSFMMEHFLEERKKRNFYSRTIACGCIRKWGDEGYNKYNKSAEEVQAYTNKLNQELGRFDPEKRHLF